MIDKKHLSLHEKKQLEAFEQAHPLLFQNPLIRSFFKNKEHVYLLIQYVTHSTEQSMQALDEAFRDYYTGVKLVHYLSQTLHWKAVHYDKRLRKEAERFPLTEEEALMTREQPYTKAELPWLEELKTPLTEKLGDEQILRAFSQLTQRQKQVLQLVYGEGHTLTETGCLLGITQQGASKIHYAALCRLRKILIEEKEESR
ncbi:sigma-70 family RNA polymerase sigma factor [Alkalicoccus halolimnae]|uniref:Sigma-70 family RNA polymerase sigma factor n=1 Tax=Alkalicoccus halolimnae TaxID=1667239 RepID=A0A5C7FPZ2_9BACI|nr:sigma-70 family RNA polymerase sigma factor [Alkalicoccus halolimnae]TXF86805.1 sigma-70 family RNA polymerase sigma factor [Alkalicoccus halolimnae]